MAPINAVIDTLRHAGAQIATKRNSIWLDAVRTEHGAQFGFTSRRRLYGYRLPGALHRHQ
jgi:hypothetical protein